MKFREQKVKPEMLMEEGYEGDLIRRVRNMSSYWEYVQIYGGNKFYINYFTGEMSREPKFSENIKGGLLAYDMGLGKTVSIFSLIYDQLEYPRRPGVLCANNLYVTVNNMLPGPMS